MLCASVCVLNTALLSSSHLLHIWGPYVRPATVWLLEWFPRELAGARQSVSSSVMRGFSGLSFGLLAILSGS